jgi:hypothetical protein
LQDDIFRREYPLNVALQLPVDLLHSPKFEEFTPILHAFPLNAVFLKY